MGSHTRSIFSLTTIIIDFPCTSTPTSPGDNAYRTMAHLALTRAFLQSAVHQLLQLAVEKPWSMPGF